MTAVYLLTLGGTACLSGLYCVGLTATVAAVCLRGQMCWLAGQTNLRTEFCNVYSHYFCYQGYCIAGPCDPQGRQSVQKHAVMLRLRSVAHTGGARTTTLVTLRSVVVSVRSSRTQLACICQCCLQAGGGKSLLDSALSWVCETVADLLLDICPACMIRCQGLLSKACIAYTAGAVSHSQPALRNSETRVNITKRHASACGHNCWAQPCVDAVPLAEISHGRAGVSG